ncbi:hypothetical protein FN846DRAFT_909977 [Sphaerosporella brunnea]|uniref:Uncharacterized protein n=1 Tax=Sphaerosporella brunnea TaxID=1250544 RepID=A0A5J5EQL8_9PEZI|nr:hypothetical protein FN846DRAFT_909977 [Sphaerosporella brunnea]
MATMRYIQNQHNIAPPLGNAKVHLTIEEAAIVNGWFPDEHPGHGGDPARWARALVALATDAGLATLWPALFVGRPLQVVEGSVMFHILTQVVIVGTTAVKKRRGWPAVVPRALPPAGALMIPPAQQQHLLQQQVQQLQQQQQQHQQQQQALRTQLQQQQQQHRQQQQQHQQQKQQHQQRQQALRTQLQQEQQQHQQRQQALRTELQQAQRNEQQLQQELQRQAPGSPQGLQELRQEVREANQAHSKKLDALAEVVNSIAPRIQPTPHTIIINIVSLDLRFAVSRLCTLPWLVSRIARYFLTAHAEYKLGAFVQFPLAAVHHLTADNVWEMIVNKPRNAEITVFGQKWEQWAFGDGLILRYRASNERLTVPRTAPLCWLVARVAHWFQRADHGFLLIAELPDFSRHELQNDKDWRDIAEQRHIDTIWLSTKL